MFSKELILREIAVAEEQIDNNEPVEENVNNEESNATENDVQANEVNEDGYVIDGEVYSQDDIREWRQGYLRQSDYTKKTQELSQERQKVQDAIELYDYLKNNPDVAEQLINQNNKFENKVPTKENKALQDLNYRLASMEIDNQLSRIKAKDNTVDEVQLLNIATQNNCPIDVAYNIYRGMNFDKILEQKLKERSTQLTEEIKNNNNVTKTLINNGDSKNTNSNFGLSNDEIIMAGKLGMSLEEYSKWK